MRARIWLYPGMAGWHFVTMPRKQAAEVRRTFGEFARGWGSVPVTVSVGGLTWKTSIFPDKKSGSYLLPLKAAVRKAEGVEAGDMVTVRLRIEMT